MWIVFHSFAHAARSMLFAMQVRLRPTRDHTLVQIVDAALADATQRSGHWLVCRPGCTQCCMGPFAINQLDAARLRAGLADLEKADPGRAARVRARVKQTVSRLAELPGGFPGDCATGILSVEDDSEEFDRFTDLADNEPCSV